MLSQQVRGWGWVFGVRHRVKETIIGEREEDRKSDHSFHLVKVQT